MSAQQKAGIIASPEDVATAKALIAALASEPMPSGRHADCAALCVGDIEGWLEVAAEYGATRHPLAYSIEHCRWRFNEEFKLPLPAALARVQGGA